MHQVKKGWNFDHMFIAVIFLFPTLMVPQGDIGQKGKNLLHTL